ncbi:MAG: 4Fe-4S dicluster domain-containing protein [Planctomycetota bacterium]|jgi:ferredoxin-type protein NapG
MTGPEEISRRDWLRGGFARARDKTPSASPPVGTAHGAFPVLRPPGAVDEETFLRECTRCNDCLEACPHDAIVLAPARYRQAAGTPMIDPARSPCRLCPDTPCIEVCEPGVLTDRLPIKMGTALIVEQTCLAHQQTTCTVCSEHCPVEDAIEVVSGKPRVVEARCTGCGICHWVCPAPSNAVIVMPLRERPPRPAAEEPGDGG